MKERIITLISTIMMCVPWTILPLRMNQWALKSPTAEIMIASYAAFMILSGVFTVWAYTKGNVKNGLMKLCVVMNSVYSVGGLVAFAMMLLPKLV
ncbi:hypothetical protein [Anaerosporobacter faecicola]|uniref:hypothetical protein n=1 Tax=Anaerosporobacter faecicola TaxID=2718714 RepID=UPI00143985D9|nr:hypothetical protein [Anaerosporobacter faecicola]